MLLGYVQPLWSICKNSNFFTFDLEDPNVPGRHPNVRQKPRLHLSSGYME